MNLLFLIILGAMAGWIASVVMKTDYAQGTLGDILLGIVGALVGGYIFNMFGSPGVTGFDLYSLVVSVIGAIVVIYIGRLLHK